ncbi:hypothetical protein BC827DRAFT_1085873, partial [Russula dissimulans]
LRSQDRYPALQAQHPSLNRRALLLLIADEFWSLDAQSWTALSALTPPQKRASAVGFLAKDADEDGDNTAPPGVVLRTDYSTGSDDAWAVFCRALHDAEREF